MKTIDFDPLSESDWNSKKEHVELSIAYILVQIRTPALRSELQRYIDALMNRANHPTDYLPESVEDARHDLLLLSGCNGTD
jgi:hypothetical protein